MKLTVREAAALLGTNESEIYRWIEAREIPCHQIHDQHRFHRAELLEWATERGLVTSPEAFSARRRSVDGDPTSLAAALEFGGVHYAVPATDLLTTLTAITDRLPLSEPSEREFLRDALLAREALGSTGVGDGIAIPHVRAPAILSVPRAALSLCFLECPVEFGAIDRKPVHTVFSMVTLTTRSHLQLLARLSSGLADSRFRGAVLERAPREQLLSAAAEVDQRLEPAGSP